jgi:hypothetical protein
MKKFFSLLNQNLFYVLLGFGINSLVVAFTLTARYFFIAPVSIARISIFFACGIALLTICPYGILQDAKKTNKSIN